MKTWQSKRVAMAAVVAASLGAAPGTAQAQMLPIGDLQPIVIRRDPPPENACGNVSQYPTIFDAGAVSPPALNADGSQPPNWNRGNARVERSGIQYVAANFVRVRLETDGSTEVVKIRVGRQGHNIWFLRVTDHSLSGPATRSRCSAAAWA